jgi:hypothetical protein
VVGIRDHGISINNALTKALLIHGGPSILLFEVSVLLEACSSSFSRSSVP